MSLSIATYTTRVYVSLGLSKQKSKVVTQILTTTSSKMQFLKEGRASN